ncbi:hypothetical protein CesoFtcFv8_014389 [Champsocephalus esox]|uniref:Uncharacterized protein n=1 Tax=Champsocephalus esox TaxID=159716 RepID=A0AAN8BVA1_9TELE|nr:hypothetical protein CesoFtcFv8_014389 [Champsocephalus esox]
MIYGGLLPPVEYGCTGEVFTPESSRRDRVDPRFGLGLLPPGVCCCAEEDFTTAGACFSPVLVLLLQRPAFTLGISRRDRSASTLLFSPVLCCCADFAPGTSRILCAGLGKWPISGFCCAC